MKKHNILLVFILVMFFGACRKADRDFDDSTMASEDVTRFQTYLSNILLITDEVAKKAYGAIPAYTSGYLDCATVATNLSGTPNTISIDFGSGCAGPDGKFRKGKIVLSMNQNYTDSGSVTTINFINFYMGDMLFQGDITYINFGQANGMDIWEYNLTNLEIDNDAADWFTYHTAKGRRILVNENIPTDISDDIYAITGTFSGTSRSGNSFSGKITDSLTFENNCLYIKAGILLVTPSNLNPRSIDYGAGSCDNKVIVNISETDYLILLD